MKIFGTKNSLGRMIWGRNCVFLILTVLGGYALGGCGGKSSGSDSCTVGDPDSCPEGQECRVDPDTGKGICVYLPDAGQGEEDGDVVEDGTVQEDGTTEDDGGTEEDGGMEEDGGTEEDGGMEEDGGTGCEPEGLTRCVGNIYEICHEGEWQELDACVDADHCVLGFGCVECLQGQTRCEEDTVQECNSVYQWEDVLDCAANETCQDATCIHDCEPQLLGVSHWGCEFWAADLDNEWMSSEGIAAEAQFGVVVTNPNDYEVQVEVFYNTENFGLPLGETVVTSEVVGAFSQLQLDLPQREVDGSMGQNGDFVPNSGSGTFVSSHAYRVLTDGPVAVYQFNPIVNQYSNDSSLLLPTHTLGQEYWVMGSPTANPCGIDMMPIDSIPDHAALTIVGTEEDTQVTVFLTHAIMASGGNSGAAISETEAGQEVTLTIGPYDVLNLESLQLTGSMTECQQFVQSGYTGDFTGSIVTTSKPVVVFTNLERGLVFGFMDPPTPPNWDGDTCCTDHLEAQLPPIDSLGLQHVAGRSPIRSTGGYEEPDLYRVLATQNNTVITTNLEAPFDEFTLDASGVAEFWSDSGVILEAQGGEVLLFQGMLPYGYTEGGEGDPSIVWVPPVDQLLTNYAFPVPDTLSSPYAVVTYPEGADLMMDGDTLDASTLNCTQRTIGTLETTTWHQLTCGVETGYHSLQADVPIGATLYGIGNTSSYAHPAGAGL